MSLRARSRFDASNLRYIKDKLIEYHSYRIQLRDATIPCYLGYKRLVFAGEDRKIQL